MTILDFIVAQSAHRPATGVSVLANSNEARGPRRFKIISDEELKALLAESERQLLFENQTAFLANSNEPLTLIFSHGESIC